MISKVILGKSFKGCCRYVCGKPEAEILFFEGVRVDSIFNMAKDFSLIHGQRPNLKKAVLHTSVSFAYADQSKLSSELMTIIAKKYINKLGLGKNQVVCVRHHDAKHDHFHLIINRVGFDSNVSNDSFIKNRAARACDQLEEEFELTVARGQSKAVDIKHNSPLKNEMKAVVKSAIEQSIKSGKNHIDELQADLAKKGIEMKVQYQSTGRVNGLSFRWNNFSMKGSAIDKRFSYKRLENLLGRNPKNHIDLIINNKSNNEYEK